MKSTRCRMSVPRTTWGYLLILGVIVVGAVMREINLLIILSGMMAGPLFLSWQLIRITLRQLRCQRRFPATAFAQRPVRVELELTNERQQLDSWALRLEDQIRCVTPGLETDVHVAHAFLPQVPVGQSRATSYTIWPGQRGRYELGPLRVATRIPVGLLDGNVTTSAVDTLIVWPRLGQLESSWRELVRQERAGQHQRRRQGLTDGDFFGLREWRAGDSRRWVHWRSSAKRNELIVRQFEQHRHQDLVVILDLGQVPAAAASAAGGAAERVSRAAIELAVSFTATLLAEHCQRGGSSVTFALADAQPQRLRGVASGPMLSEFLSVLAEATPTPSDPLPEMLGDVLRGTSPQDRVVWIAPQPVNPLDAARFPNWQDAPAPVASLARSVRVDSSSLDFANYFRFDSLDAPPRSASRADGAQVSVTP